MKRKVASIIVAVLTLLIIIYGFFWSPSSPISPNNRPNQRLVPYIKAEYGIDDVIYKVRDAGYAECDNVVLKEGLMYYRFDWFSKDPVACYIPFIRESQDLMEILGASKYNARGEWFNGSFWRMINSGFQGTPYKPFSRLMRGGVNVHALVPAKQQVDTVVYFSYRPSPEALATWPPYVSPAFTYEDFSLVIRNSSGIPKWVDNWELENDWRDVLRHMLFINECGSYFFKPDENKLEVVYTVRPTGAMCYFTLNVPSGHRINVTSAQLTLKADKPAKAFGKTFFIAQWGVLGSSKINRVDAGFPYHDVPKGYELNDYLYKRPLFMELLRGDEVTVPLTVKQGQNDEMYVIAFLFGLASNSKVDRIPEFEARFVIDYEVST